VQGYRHVASQVRDKELAYIPQHTPDLVHRRFRFCPVVQRATFVNTASNMPSSKGMRLPLLAINGGAPFVEHGLIVCVAVQLVCRDPVVRRPPTDAQLIGQGAFRPALLQVLAWQHSSLPSLHR
jgi:hypothetical protein